MLLDVSINPPAEQRGHVQETLRSPIINTGLTITNTFSFCSVDSRNRAQEPVPSICFLSLSPLFLFFFFLSSTHDDNSTVNQKHTHRLYTQECWQ